MAAPSTPTGSVSPVPVDPASSSGTAVERTADDAGPGPDDLPRSRRFDRKLLAASLIIALGICLIGVALVRSVTGDEVTKLPSAIESILPAPDAVQVLQQTQIVIDLADGYEGRLVIDDVALPTVSLDEVGSQEVEPGEQIDIPPGVVFEPGNGTLTFTPGGDSPITSFEPGSHRVQVVFWRTLEGEANARSYAWTFATI